MDSDLTLPMNIQTLSNHYRPFMIKALQKMIRVPGQSGDERQRCEVIAQLCRESGFDDVSIDGLGSVVACLGKGPKTIAFDAHIDTVGIGDIAQWSLDPFEGNLQGDYLVGRGASDQLGGAAAMLGAIRILKDLGYANQFRIYCTFTVLEEDCDGIAWLYLIEKESFRPDFVVSTEPSINHLHRGHRGRMEIEVLLNGRACHGSRPHEGDSAAYKAARAALAIEKLNADLQPDPENFLGKGTVVVSSMSAQGPSQCSVPDQARLYLDRRLTWGETAEQALEQVRTTIANATGDQEFRVCMPIYGKRGYRGTDFDQELYFPTWQIPADHRLVHSAQQAYEMLYHKAILTEAHIGSTNAVAFAGKYGIPTIILGPGDPAEAHKANEKVAIHQIVTSCELYALLPYVLEQNI
jgi:putative selenium metabolism hydrolase